MKNFISSVASFIREEDGASAVEYGILVAAIAAVIIAVTIVVGNQIDATFKKVCLSLASITSGVSATACN